MLLYPDYVNDVINDRKSLCSLLSSDHQGSTRQSGQRFWQRPRVPVWGVCVPDGSSWVEEGGPGCGPTWRWPSHLCSGEGSIKAPPTCTLSPTHSLSSLSSQSRGGPLKFELSSWLQIEGAGPEDSGTYYCIARNNLGSVSASAMLGILGAGDWRFIPVIDYSCCHRSC